jgi:chromosomal replication initiation ATPase DnaA
MGGCENRKAHLFEKDAEAAVESMGEVVPYDLYQPCRKANIVWARYMVEYYLRSLGYSLHKVAKLFSRDHATVVHSVKEVDKMLRAPKMYPEETKIWNKFQEKLSLKK